MMTELTTDQLRGMSGQEGLILQGCGGDLQEWLDGINDLFTEEGILLDGTRFKDAAFFRHDGLTNLLFTFDGVKVNGGRLAAWRVNTHEVFGGTWLSDYVPNYLEGFVNDQHTVQTMDLENDMGGFDNGSQ